MKKLKPGETVTYTVIGSGEFPFDMLRYDRCWPKREAEINRVLNPRGLLIDPRAVTIEGVKEPTRARWESFGWEVHGL